MPRGAKRVAIVGAGVAGLVAGRALRDAGCHVVVFDKGRAPAGRVSSRREPGFGFDHGAQYFTVEDARFDAVVRGWLAQGVVAEWAGRFGSVSEGAARALRSRRTRYVGTPTMGAVARHLAAGLEVQSGVTVTRIDGRPGAWRITAADESMTRGFDAVLVTTPAPQARRLLEAAPELASRTDEARLRPCWAVMLAFEEPLDFPWDGVFVQGSALSWAARNSSKPGRPAGETWVLHAGPDWSETWLEADDAEVETRLVSAFAQAIGRVLPPALFATAHRWRFALPDPPLEDDCLFDGELCIGAAGDWCGGPRVEGAFLSGRAVARSTLEALGVAPEPSPT